MKKKDMIKREQKSGVIEKDYKVLLNDIKRLLFEIIQFSKAYPIVHTLCAQLSWSHYGALIRIKKKENSF